MTANIPPTTLAGRVAAGAALLDETTPGWWRRIDLDALDLQDSCRCVLGQLHGDYFDGYRVLAAALGTRVLPEWQHGFNVKPAQLRDTDVVDAFVAARVAEYAALDEAWIAEIKGRWEAHGGL